MLISFENVSEYACKSVSVNALISFKIVSNCQ
jgi:hypothetical protein